MKICLNCGDKLLDAAQKCPSCGTKDKGFPIVEPSDKVRIQQIVSSVPHPKDINEAEWKINLDTRGMKTRDAVRYRIGGESRQQVIEAREKEERARQRLRQLDEDGIPYCPKCHSTSLTANKKGFGIGKAIIGAALAGPIGLVGGNIGARQIRITCLKCGYQFWAGQK